MATRPPGNTPIRNEINGFVAFMSVLCTVFGAVFFLLSRYVLKYNLLQSVIFSIGILVANIPESLLACITISLTIIAGKMFER